MSPNHWWHVRERFGVSHFGSWKGKAQWLAVHAELIHSSAPKADGMESAHSHAGWRSSFSLGCSPSLNPSNLVFQSPDFSPQHVIDSLVTIFFIFGFLESFKQFLFLSVNENLWSGCQEVWLSYIPSILSLSIGIHSKVHVFLWLCFHHPQ